VLDRVKNAARRRQEAAVLRGQARSHS